VSTISRKPYACPNCERRFHKEIGLADHQRDAHGKPRENVQRPLDAEIDPNCLECGKMAKLVKGDAIYPHRPDLYHKNFWLCRCGAYCGCHGATTRPLGFPAGAETRRARNAAHAAFDPLWKSGKMTRREAYTWLASQLGIAPEDCHVGMMRADRAWQVAEICQPRAVAC